MKAMFSNSRQYCKFWSLRFSTGLSAALQSRNFWRVMPFARLVCRKPYARLMALAGVAVIAGAQMMACANRSQAPEALLALASADPGILILGDSLTERSDGFGLKGELEPTIRVSSSGIPGFDFSNWVSRVDEAFAAGARPGDSVLLVLGTNDGYRFSPPTFLANVHELDRQLRIRTSGAIYYFLVPRTNDAGLAASILANNAALVAGLPPTSRLIDLDGPFEAARSSVLLYPVDDPIHPTAAGYRIIAQTIRARLLFP